MKLWLPRLLRDDAMVEDTVGEFHPLTQYVTLKDHQADLAEKDAEIARLKHELKQDEYKFIRNHDEYYQELTGLRETKEQLQADLDRVLGEAVWAMTEVYNGLLATRYIQRLPVGGDVAINRVEKFLDDSLIQSWRARQGTT